MKKIKKIFFSRGVNLKIFFQRVKILNMVGNIIIIFRFILLKLLNARLSDWLDGNRFISRIQ